MTSPALGVLTGLAAGIVAFAALSALHQPDAKPKYPVLSDKAQKQLTASVREPYADDPPALQAPPPSYPDDADAEKPAEPSPDTDEPLPSRFVRSPFAEPDTHAVAPPTAPAPPRATKSEPPDTNEGIANNTPNTAQSPSASAAFGQQPEPSVAPLPAPRPMSVEVDVQPKEGSVFKRIAGTVPAVAGHVPLLGKLRPFHHEDRNRLVAARPAAGLEPQIPASMTRGVHDEVDVEIQASIDDRGKVRSTEITRGTQTPLDTIAENKVRSVLWRPARAGDRNVPMDVVVHYRFNPNHE